MGKHGISVSRRIALLVVVEAMMISAMVTQVSMSLRTLSADAAYSKRFTLAPLQAMPQIFEDASAAVGEAEVVSLGTPASAARIEQTVDEVAAFVRRYRHHWMTAENSGVDARRFRGYLAETGELSLLEDERVAVAEVEAAVAKLRETRSRSRGTDASPALLDLHELRRTLRRLAIVDIRFLEVDHDVSAQRAERALTNLLASGLACLVVTVLLGIYVRRAIGPRIGILARKVRTFKETGEFTRTKDLGIDEIGVLANALDAGFAAIRGRERERERFLSVAAHELKTPITTISGFAAAALASPKEDLRRRAIEVIHQQAGRLGRLVQDLLLAASARQRELAFHPTPIEVRGLVQQTLKELEGGRSRFVLAPGKLACFLADEQLLGHALWQVLSYAAAVAGPGQDVTVRVGGHAGQIVFDAVIPAPVVPRDELDRAFLPFASVQYEGTGSRYAFGLYLSREIARLHGGALDAIWDPQGELTLHLTVPA